jgi:hypothetical protein
MVPLIHLVFIWLNKKLLSQRTVPLLRLLQTVEDNQRFLNLQKSRWESLDAVSSIPFLV